MKQIKKTFLLLACLLVAAGLSAQFEKQSKYLSAADGLSQDGINCLYQDSLGYIWIGTSYGLNVYDGYRLINIQPEPGDTNSLSGTEVRSIMEDKCGNIWVTTMLGISSIDRLTRKITNYTNTNGAVPHGYAEGIGRDSWGNLWFGTASSVYRLIDGKLQVFDFDTIAQRLGTYYKFYTGIATDSRGCLWLGTQNDGILHYDIAKAKATVIKHGGMVELLSDTIRRVYCDRKDNVWIAYAAGGISRYDIRTGKTEQFPQFDFTVNSIYEDADGTIYWGTDGQGCFTFSGGHWAHFTVQNADFYNDKITAVLRDRQQSMWVAFRHGGIGYYSRTEKPILTQRYGNGGILPYNLVNDIITDRNGRVWISNDKGGILVQENGNGTKLRAVAKEAGVTAQCLFQSTDGTIWCGTYSSGIVAINPSTLSYRVYRNRPGDKNSIAINNIRGIDQDPLGKLWFALHGYGFASFDPQNGTFRNFTFDDTTAMRYNGAWSSAVICQGGKVWVGTTIGLYCFDQETNRGYYYRNVQSLPHSLSDNNVLSLFLDSRGRLWAGTMQGVNLFDPHNHSFKHYFRSDGLPDNIIVSITEDKSLNMWFGTGKGLSQLNKGTFVNFTATDGLQGNEFARNAAFCGSDGRLYFGGLEGYSSFVPEQFVYNTRAPEVHITGFKIFNDTELGTGYLPAIAGTTLSYKQNSIGFEFTAFNFINSEKNQFAYRLEGVDAEWVHCGTLRQVTYSNLAPGTYTFRVKACNNDGVWNETGTGFTFRIMPPFYLRWYAYIVYLSMALMVLYFFRKFSIISITKKNAMLLEHLEREKLEEIHQAKLRFFTDVSHDIRTPLTLIIDPINRMLANWGNGENAQKQLVIVQKNAGRMLELINQLLDFRKIESGHRSLQCANIDVVPLIREIGSNFSVFLDERQVSFYLPADNESHYCFIDQEKLKKIISNLLSNASKFTPPGGCIKITVGEYPATKNFPCGYLDVSVADTGPGIASSMLRSIFERFRQGSSGTEPAKGWGIGLSLARHLAELHHGTLTVQSSPGKGSCFSLRVPLGDAHLLPEDMQIRVHVEANQPIFNSVSTQYTYLPKRNRQEIVLLVEDDPDILKYLADMLIDEYSIVTATNGAAGLEMAQVTVPDIIVADVQMPEMDGFRMTKLLKENPATSHIPVVLLTAFDMAEQRMAGLSSGAVEYLSKPVDSALLRIKLHNLLDLIKLQQMQVKKIFAQQSTAPQEDLSAEYVFLGKIQKIIESQLHNAQISVQDLATEMGLSRSQLFRKFKAILNQNPKDFIQTTRLSHAKRLLENSGLSIKEIAYEVGFSDARYFSRCFLKEYGLSPRAWKKQQTGQDIEDTDGE